MTTDLLFYTPSAAAEFTKRCNQAGVQAAQCHRIVTVWGKTDGAIVAPILSDYRHHEI